MQSGPQRSSSNMIWIGLALVGILVLCCCGGAGAYFFMARGGSSFANVPSPDPIPTSQPGPSMPPIPDSAGSGPSVPEAPPQSLTVTMTVDTATGVPGLSQGSTCIFPIVHYNDRGDLACQAHATCAGVALYGDSETNGFFPCQFSASPAMVSGADDGTTAADQDPSFVINSTASTIVIADDSTGHHGAFSVTGHVSVR